MYLTLCLFFFPFFLGVQMISHFLYTLQLLELFFFLFLLIQVFIFLGKKFFSGHGPQVLFTFRLACISPLAILSISDACFWPCLIRQVKSIPDGNGLNMHNTLSFFLQSVNPVDPIQKWLRFIVFFIMSWLFGFILLSSHARHYFFIFILRCFVIIVFCFLAIFLCWFCCCCYCYSWFGLFLFLFLFLFFWIFLLFWLFNIFLCCLLHFLLRCQPYFFCFLQFDLAIILMMPVLAVLVPTIQVKLSKFLQTLNIRNQTQKLTLIFHFFILILQNIFMYNIISRQVHGMMHALPQHFPKILLASLHIIFIVIFNPMRVLLMEQNTRFEKRIRLFMLEQVGCRSQPYGSGCIVQVIEIRLTGFYVNGHLIFGSYFYIRAHQTHIIVLQGTIGVYGNDILIDINRSVIYVLIIIPRVWSLRISLLLQFVRLVWMHFIPLRNLIYQSRFYYKLCKKLIFILGLSTKMHRQHANILQLYHHEDNGLLKVKQLPADLVQIYLIFRSIMQCSDQAECSYCQQLNINININDYNKIMKYLLIAILTIAKSIQSYFPNPPSIFSKFSTSSLQTKISSPSFPSASHTWQCRISAWPRKQIKNDFHNWMHKNYKKYLDQEELIRFYNFQDNSHTVHGHNKMGKSSFTMKLNKFADLSQLQFKWNYLMPSNMSLNPAIIAQLPGTKNGNKRLLQSVNFDWRDKVQFNVVKDQGKCSACYAFADMAALQLNWAIRHKTKAPALSEQQILDCCHEEYLCDGCKSGSLGATFDYLADYGIAYISDYPYTSKPSACNTSAQRYRFLFQESSYFQTSGLQSTLYYLLNVGPLAVAVDPTDWIFYDKGVFNKCKTSDFIYNHAIVLIGTQADGSWIFRNSWGDQWGENGYGKLASGNSCGILNYVFLPLVV